MSKLEITVGSDPEFVVFREGKPVSCVDILKRPKKNDADYGVHTKETPIDLGDGVLCYADNALLEARLNPVKPDMIVWAIGCMMRKLHAFLDGMGDDLGLVSRAACEYPPEYMKHELNWQTGCSVNFDAYREEPNKPAKFTDTTRTGSFHIHIGNEDYMKAKDSDPLMGLESKIMAIKLLDLYLGLASVIFDRDETSERRRRLYGRAGEFRPTPYGIEYRVLGPYCASSPRLIRLVFDLVEQAMAVLESGEGAERLKAFKPEKIINTINLVDRRSAGNMLDKLGLPTGLRNEIELTPSNELGASHQSWL